MKSLDIHPQFITDSAGEEVGVFLPISEYQQILEELEDYEDIKAFDEAENKSDKEFVPYRQAIEEIKRASL